MGAKGILERRLSAQLEVLPPTSPPLLERMNPILMNEFKREPEAIREAMRAATARVIDSGWYVMGQELQAFETEWSSLCGIAHSVGVGNGMDAIEIALRASDIGPGDEVITTPMTAFASVLAILRSGATPVLADIDPDTALLSMESVQRCISSQTKAVLLVHLYGQIKAMTEWQTFCHQHKISLIEDCAQAHLASEQGKVAGSFGTAGAYSFYPTKNLGALGDAGMLVTNSKEIADHALILRNYGQSERYHHPEIGLNSRLDEMQAAILRARVKWLHEFTSRRQRIADRFHEGIDNVAIKVLARPSETAAHVYHLFVVLCQDRDALQQHLKTHDIHSLIHYPIPIHHQTPCIKIGRDPVGLAHSEQHAEHCLSLPCHPQMSDDEIERVIAAVNSYKGT